MVDGVWINVFSDFEYSVTFLLGLDCTDESADVRGGAFLQKSY